jgi:predicted acylesterase/phospholipase RssA
MAGMIRPRPRPQPYACLWLLVVAALLSHSPSCAYVGAWQSGVPGYLSRRQHGPRHGARSQSLGRSRCLRALSPQQRVNESDSPETAGSQQQQQQQLLLDGAGDLNLSRSDVASSPPRSDVPSDFPRLRLLRMAVTGVRRMFGSSHSEQEPVDIPSPQTEAVVEMEVGNYSMPASRTSPDLPMDELLPEPVRPRLPPRAGVQLFFKRRVLGPLSNIRKRPWSRVQSLSPPGGAWRPNRMPVVVGLSEGVRRRRQDIRKGLISRILFRDGGVELGDVISVGEFTWSSQDLEYLDGERLPRKSQDSVDDDNSNTSSSSSSSSSSSLISLVIPAIASGWGTLGEAMSNLALTWREKEEESGSLPLTKAWNGEGRRARVPGIPDVHIIDGKFDALDNAVPRLIDATIAIYDRIPKPWGRTAEENLEGESASDYENAGELSKNQPPIAVIPAAGAPSAQQQEEETEREEQERESEPSLWILTLPRSLFRTIRRPISSTLSALVDKVGSSAGASGLTSFAEESLESALEALPIWSLSKEEAKEEERESVGSTRDRDGAGEPPSGFASYIPFFWDGKQQTGSPKTLEGSAASVSLVEAPDPPGSAAIKEPPQADEPAPTSDRNQGWNLLRLFFPPAETDEAKITLTSQYLDGIGSNGEPEQSSSFWSRENDLQVKPIAVSEAEQMELDTITPRQLRRSQSETRAPGSSSELRSTGFPGQLSIQLTAASEAVRVQNGLDFGMMSAAAEAASAVKTAAELAIFLSEGGLQYLLQALLSSSSAPPPHLLMESLILPKGERRKKDALSLSAISALSRLVSINTSIADNIIACEGAVDALLHLVKAPLPSETGLGEGLRQAAIFNDNGEGGSSGDLGRRRRSSKSIAQEAALDLLLKMVLSSEQAVEILRKSDIRSILEELGGASKYYRQQAELLDLEGGSSSPSSSLASWLRARRGKPPPSGGAGAAVRATANKLLSALGYHRWVPRQPGQRGLRILAMDGGGTRGVLTVALLNHIMKGVGKDPHEIFDVICGTSTGGILGGLFAVEKMSVSDSIELYDKLIIQIFSRMPWASAKLLFRQAQYSEAGWESILEGILGEKRMIDTAGDPSDSKLVLCSTIFNLNPLTMQLWRNYNYPPGVVPEHRGSFRDRVRDCIRATTAAPTYFSPVKQGDMLYCDGAFLANNPAAISVAEAQLIFPGVPIECVVSIGTGVFENVKEVPNVGWDTIINQLINSATDTESVDASLRALMPRDTYYRFNPRIQPFNIDETDPKRLAYLKERAEEFCSTPEVRAQLTKLQALLRDGVESIQEAPPPELGSFRPFGAGRQRIKQRLQGFQQKGNSSL